MRKIGILCTSIFHYIHFKGLGEELTKYGFKVIFVNCSTNDISKENNLTNFLKANNIPHCSYRDIFINKLIFEVILAPYFLHHMKLIELQNKLYKFPIIKVRLMYGYAKDYWNYAEWNSEFDLILSYGDYSKKRLTPYSTVVNIGHPRIKSKYNENLIDINGRTFTNSKNKKKLLYCPTWTDISSINEFVLNIERFTSVYQVIIKLHHGNDKLLVKELNQYSDVYIFGEETDLFDLLSKSDVVLTDYSGAIFDAMLFRKPIVLFDTLSEGMLHTYDKDKAIKTKNNSVEMEYLFIEKFQNSLDVQMRSILPHSSNIYEILQLLKDVHLTESIPYKDLISDLYSFEDEFASKRGAEAINQILKRENKMNENEEDTLIQSNTERIISFLDNNKNNSIAIWGTGALGETLFELLIKFNFDINCFYDIDKNKQGQTIFGKKIVKPQFKDKVIITVTTKYDDVRNQLASKSLVEGEDYVFLNKI